MIPGAVAAKALKESPVKRPRMQFVLTGFTQDLGCRVFAFDGVAPNQNRMAFTVRADLALVRKYGIPIQDLPLLCRGVLEQRDESSDAQTFIFAEEEMRSCAAARAAAKQEAARKRKPPRRHSTENLGAAWRGPHLSGQSSRHPV